MPDIQSFPPFTPVRYVFIIIVIHTLSMSEQERVKTSPFVRFLSTEQQL